MRITLIILLILLSAISYVYASETVILDSSTAVIDSTNQSNQAITAQMMTETQSFERGKLDGKPFILPNKWFYVGILHGSTLFIPGIAIASFCATGKEAPSIPPNVDMRSYRLGYIKQSKNNNRNSALIGGCIGAIILYTTLSIADH